VGERCPSKEQGGDDGRERNQQGRAERGFAATASMASSGNQ
jgi:hypothetical protein